LGGTDRQAHSRHRQAGGEQRSGQNRLCVLESHVGALFSDGAALVGLGEEFTRERALPITTFAGIADVAVTRIA
jgi:hypothetical protein